jgi:hypothetical protein
MSELFVAGVPAEHVLDRLAKAGGHEVESRKLESPESSAALAVNTFGWFYQRPASLPPFPGLHADYPPTCVDVEYCARFPWSGGRHPWLDAIVETPQHLIGIESKRFEPYRDRKTVSLSAAYDRKVWGDGMQAYEAMRDQLRSRAQAFELLDAAQLVKHAFGLVTDARRKRKAAVLVYLYAEPRALDGKALSGKFAPHRAEVAQFTEAVAEAAVAFHALSYGDWLSSWPQHGAVAEHGKAIVARFDP